jgi:uncharacterized cupin superfamily protein
VGITHFEAAEREQVAVGHLRSTWTYLGDAAESVGVGVNRIQVVDGGWATPAHEHGREEEIFYVLAGRGISWQDGRTVEIAAGDCIVYLPDEGAHTVHGVEGLDVLAFGLRFDDESPRFPRQGLSRVGNRAVETMPGAVDGIPIQWLREAELGAPELPAPDPRPPVPAPAPPRIVAVADVEPQRLERPRVARSRRNLGRAAGSVRAGLQHVEVQDGKESTAQHCHSIEEEIFVILEGDGTCSLGDEEIPVRPGHVVARPPGTGVAHVFRAGSGGLTYLAYGTREPGDVCYYPRSNKIAFRGIGLIARLEALDYWDGED